MKLVPNKKDDSLKGAKEVYFSSEGAQLESVSESDDEK